MERVDSGGSSYLLALLSRAALEFYNRVVPVPSRRKTMYIYYVKGVDFSLGICYYDGTSRK